MQVEAKLKELGFPYLTHRNQSQPISLSCWWVISFFFPVPPIMRMGSSSIQDRWAQI